MVVNGKVAAEDLFGDKHDDHDDDGDHTGTAHKRKMLAGASILTKMANRVKGARKA